MDKTLRIGSRESALAVIQAESVADAIRRFDRNIKVEIVTIKTRGDMIQDRPLESVGGKGLFIKELDTALLEGRIDAAVHSLKDIPAFLEKGIAVKAFLRRDDPADVLVLPSGTTKPEMSRPLGCSGGRRVSQARRLFPGWETMPIRGNVLTRLKKLDEGEYGALVLAAASLLRLRLPDRISRVFSTDEMIPAAGQGIIAVCARAEDEDAYFAAIDDGVSRAAATSERAFVRTLDGGCGKPVAAYAEVSGDALVLYGLYAEDEASFFVTGSVSGTTADAEAPGKELAVKLLAEYHRRSGAGKGRVTLIGAGPGDPGLLTGRAEAALREADIVLYDNLAGRGVIARIPATARTVYVGKKAGAHTLRQEEINSLLLKEAAAGKKVARLKGGDPFLFGRGGEELELLSLADIPFEVIPGVSSALAVPAFAGIPATHRGISSQVHIVSASLEDGKADIDHRALVQSGGTLVFLMGVSALESICSGLLEAGMGPDTPAAIIEQGSTALQRKVVSTISRLHAESLAAGIGPPAITVVGGVCALSQNLSWFEKSPLSGIRIGVTRPASRSATLSALLAGEGAEVVEIPSIEVEPIADTPLLEKALSGLRGGEWFAFTSPAGVEVFFGKLLGYGKDARALSKSRFAAIGKTTASSLAARGIAADLVPPQYSGAALGRLLARTIAKESGDPLVILPRSRIAGRELPDALAASGIRFLDIAVYDNARPPYRDDAFFLDILTEGLDWLTFTSASTVSGFVGIAGEERTSALQKQGLRSLCIGRSTEEAARRAGFDTVTAKNATLPGMVDALLEAVKYRSF
ncbi:MAG: hydroxymethylbilane synthase [Spirochaetaceae bacterium]|jgi:uroporphyrinogen III methyltransferase/synthase|nr:hydroxymethylbilane synthase [Spirochaetaceae bacterium]